MDNDINRSRIDRLQELSKRLREYIAKNPHAGLAAGIAEIAAGCGLIMLSPVIIAVGKGVMTFGFIAILSGMAGTVVLVAGSPGRSAADTYRALALGRFMIKSGIVLVLTGLIIQGVGHAMLLGGGGLILIGGAVVYKSMRRISDNHAARLAQADPEHTRAMAEVCDHVKNMRGSIPDDIALLELE